LLVGLSAVGWAGWSKWGATEVPADFQLELGRGCEGRCVSYRVSVNAAGVVDFRRDSCFDGMPAVDVPSTVPRSVVRKLHDRVNDIDIDRLAAGQGCSTGKHNRSAVCISVRVHERGRSRELRFAEASGPTPFSVKAAALSRLIQTSLGTAQIAEWTPGPDCFVASARHGEIQFEKQGCKVCHTDGKDSIGGDLLGLLGQTVTFEDGSQLVADRAYVEESILDPQRRIVKGYRPSMPSYRGKLHDYALRDLVAYLEHRSKTPAGDASAR
jgi:cytochrome c2